MIEGVAVVVLPIAQVAYTDGTVVSICERRGLGLNAEVLQLVLNRLYETEKNVRSEALLREAIAHIVSRYTVQYEELVTFLTDNQLSLLKAIAKENCVGSPMSNEFIKKYDLPSSSSVKTALDVLTDKDLVSRTPKGYAVYDHFLELWLKRLC